MKVSFLGVEFTREAMNAGIFNQDLQKNSVVEWTPQEEEKAGPEKPGA